MSIGEVNSNDIAIMCEQLGSISIGSFMVFKKKSMRGVMVLASVISTIILLLSGSRAALLGLLAAIVFVIFAGSKEGIKNNIFAILVIFIIGILFIHMLSDIDSPILDRYDANDVIDTEGSGRLPYMKAIITQIIPYYPLFGVGMGGQNIMAMGIQKQCHNIVVDPISQIGFIGYILFLAFIIPHIARSYKSLKISSVAIIPLTMTFAAIVNGIGEVVFYEKFFWNDIALCGLIGYGVFHNRIDIE
ncbi:MAG: O-antigen ligase family protein [Lachnospiraceae bacterium]|nr:O-antigen ligase family protein [Lachnospiraceae bacterium]